MSLSRSCCGIMTKDEIENVIKRFPYVTEAIRRGASEAVFYIGNRKFVIGITDEIKIVCNLVETIVREEKNELMKQMITGILAGKSDVNIMMRMPFSKNSYYARKQAFMAKIYNCCIARGLVTFEDVINERTAL